MFLLFPEWLRLSARIIIAWDSGAICFLVLAWAMITSATPQKMRHRAKLEDEGRWTILIFVVVAACISLLAIGLMLKDQKELTAFILTLHLALAGVTVVCSWLLTHTMFALHYAHDYYRENSVPSFGKARGLDFPQETQPDYCDFLYFSFVIGITCQVSDVQITSQAMRRLALMHGVLTFFFNTVILALSINTSILLLGRFSNVEISSICRITVQCPTLSDIITTLMEDERTVNNGIIAAGSCSNICDQNDPRDGVKF